MDDLGVPPFQETSIVQSMIGIDVLVMFVNHDLNLLKHGKPPEWQPYHTLVT